jgi:hypothetical protein
MPNHALMWTLAARVAEMIDCSNETYLSRRRSRSVAAFGHAL